MILANTNIVLHSCSDLRNAGVMCYASRNLYQRMELIITCAWTLSHIPATAWHCYLLWADLCIRYYLWGQSTMAGVILHTDPCLMVPGGEQCLSPDHTPPTQIIFQIQDTAQQQTSVAIIEPIMKTRSLNGVKNIWCLNRKIIWISSGSEVHRTRWSVITCTLCHTFWSHHTSEVCWPQNYLVNIILTRCDGCWRNKSE